MPEVLFTVRWPDGSESQCYSPSRAIAEFLAPGSDYALGEFLTRSRAGLTAASARVQQVHGFPCSRALGQLAEIERRGRDFTTGGSVRVLAFRSA
jgi:uncharacterized repeat protein (TIGR04042 family)